MSDSSGKSNLKSLVSQILATTPTAAAPAPSTENPEPALPMAPEPPAVDPELQALFEVYFDVEDPNERDVVFEKIVALDTPAVTAFLHAVLEHDEDEVQRAGAAAELARRNDAAGTRALEAALEDLDDTELFTHALQVLAEVQGPAFYDRAKGFWLNDECDTELKHEALLAMETTDPARALPDWVRFIAAQNDLNALPDDQLEVMMMAFVRHGYSEALPTLTALKERLAKGISDPDEREELVAFIDEGMALLKNAT